MPFSKTDHFNQSEIINPNNISAILNSSDYINPSNKETSFSNNNNHHNNNTNISNNMYGN